MIGYCGYFKLINGFEKTVYWTKDQVEEHRIKFNKAKDKKSLNNVWRSDYDAMAMKTVLRNMLGKWGILSIDMQKALNEDENEREIKEITDEVEESNIIDVEMEDESINENPSTLNQQEIEFE